MRKVELTKGTGGTKVQVLKTSAINQRKLVAVARRYGISPLDVRELQLGFAIEVSESVAQQLVDGGLAKISKKKVRSMQDKVDALTPEPLTESVEVPESEEQLSNTVDATPISTSDPAADNEEQI